MREGVFAVNKAENSKNIKVEIIVDDKKICTTITISTVSGNIFGNN